MGLGAVLMCANDLAALWLRCLAVYVEWPMLRPALICWLADRRKAHARVTHRHERTCGMRTYKIHTSRMLVLMSACVLRNAMCTDYVFRRSAMAAPFFGAAVIRAARCSAAAPRHHENQRMRALLRMSRLTLQARCGG